MEFSLSEFKPVADRVYVAVAEPDSVNIGLVVGTTGAVVIDTGSSPTQGRAILAAARVLAGEVPITHVLVTHAHHDHLFGLAGFEGVASIGHEGLRALLEERRPDAGELARFGMTDADLAAPSTTFNMASAVNLGDCHVEFAHFGRGHTDHDAVAVVPARKVAFLGDLLETSAEPWAGPDSHPGEWGASLDWIAGMMPRDCTIIPGHGPALNMDSAGTQRGEMQWLHERAEALYDAGKPAEGAWAADWPWPQEPAERFVAQALVRMREAGRPRRRPTLPLLNG